MTNLQIADDMPDLETVRVDNAPVDVINEALAIIDAALSQMVKRELVSSGEVSDLLLDVRNLLISTRQR
ncbi:MAG: hypothetical protein RL119_1759 [Actinomycetota bacterium]|jgi:hypothetical protein